MVGAASEAFRVHLVDHRGGPAMRLGPALGKSVEVPCLGGDEEHCRGIGAGRHAGAAANASRGVHGEFRVVLGDRKIIGLGSIPGPDGDESTRGDDPVEGAAIDHQVLDDREGGRPPRLDGQNVAVAEAPHVELAGRGCPPWPVGVAVDDHAALPADTFAAVMIEGDRLLPLENQPFVDHVEHLEKRHVGADLASRIGLEPSG